ncbi:UDP-glycosyltransferase 82A1 [Magnolia sinica]|uniref:UDP-glycosyltransferase 82A1 n=1 Tax=Magnolia sinica TaxID=86752 RepID=UPI00265996B1|nr:UDP-glycosyltransferase 82A1 [Magnolia sinica]
MKSKDKPQIVLIPYPAQGHITPIIQLAASFHIHGFQPLIIIPDFIHDRIVASRTNSDDGLVFLPIPDGLAEGEPRNFFTISFAMENNMPCHLDRVLAMLHEEGGGRVACVVVDLLASWAIDVASRHGIPVAGFWPAMLATYNLIAAIPDMIRTGLLSENGSPLLKGVVRFLPGQPMLSTEDLPWLVGNPAQKRSRFQFWLQTLQRSRSLPWLLVNSFPDEDCNQQQHLPSRSVHRHRPSILQVGPLTRHTRSNPSLWEEDMSCLDWLRKQKPRSVVYVSFGSWVGPIGEAKIAELALGLEATQRPFIWVLGPEWRAGLPSGYLDRVAMHGKVITWAPQKEVLRHETVGCYLTHCGWNSTVEAVEGGKPLLCYPVSGDQFVNSTYIVDVWGIGVKVGGPGRRAVEEGIKKVMEDDGEMMRRVMELKDRIMGEEGDSRAVATLTAFLDGLKTISLDAGDCISSCVSSL